MREEVLKSENDMQEAQEIYLKHVKNGEVSGCMFGNKYLKSSAGCIPLKEWNKFNKKLYLSTYPTYEFFKTADIELYNEDANKIIDKYNNEQTLIFLDPP